MGASGRGHLLADRCHADCASPRGRQRCRCVRSSCFPSCVGPGGSQLLQASCQCGVAHGKRRQGRIVFPGDARESVLSQLCFCRWSGGQKWSLVTKLLTRFEERSSPNTLKSFLPSARAQSRMSAKLLSSSCTVWQTSITMVSCAKKISRVL